MENSKLIPHPGETSGFAAAQAKLKMVGLSFMNRLVRIQTSEISLLQGSVNYCYFYLSDGRRLISARTLKYYSAVLSDGEFIRIHKSYMLNFKYIHHVLVETQEVELNNGMIVPIARRQFRQVLKKLQTYQSILDGTDKNNVGLVCA